MTTSVLNALPSFAWVSGRADRDVPGRPRSPLIHTQVSGVLIETCQGGPARR